MNTAHHPPIRQTKFAGDFPEWQARPSILPRIFHFIASGVVCLVFFGVVILAVQKGLGG